MTGRSGASGPPVGRIVDEDHAIGGEPLPSMDEIPAATDSWRGAARHRR
jgi:hypothetical protein